MQKHNLIANTLFAKPLSEFDKLKGFDKVEFSRALSNISIELENAFKGYGALYLVGLTEYALRSFLTDNRINPQKIDSYINCLISIGWTSFDRNNLNNSSVPDNTSARRMDIVRERADAAKEVGNTTNNLKVNSIMMQVQNPSVTYQTDQKVEMKYVNNKQQPVTSVTNIMDIDKRRGCYVNKTCQDILNRLDLEIARVDITKQARQNIKQIQDHVARKSTQKYAPSIILFFYNHINEYYRGSSKTLHLIEREFKADYGKIVVNTFGPQCLKLASHGYLKRVKVGDVYYYTCIQSNEISEDDIKEKLKKQIKPNPPYISKRKYGLPLISFFNNHINQYYFCDVPTMNIVMQESGIKFGGRVPKYMFRWACRSLVGSGCIKEVQLNGLVGYTSVKSDDLKQSKDNTQSENSSKEDSENSDK